MQLRRLEVRNIRSYETGRLEVGPGTTLIVGDVGAGKTSLLYAIEMALFGGAEVDAPYLVRHGAAHAEVAVRFEDGTHRYEVSRRFRRLRRKGRESFESERIAFREDGRETSYSATEVRQRVIELLGFPDNPNPQAHSDLWRWAIYVPQEKMREILSARPQERLETIRKALGVERYRTAAENAQELAGDLRADARHTRESADRLQRFDLEFAEATEAADRLRRERAELEQQLVASTAALEAARRKVEQSEEVARRLDADLQEVERLGAEQSAEAAAIAEHRRLAGERAAEAGRRRRERDESAAEAGARESLRSALAAADEAYGRGRAELDRRSESVRALAASRAELAASERSRSELTERLARAVADRAQAEREAERAASEGPAHEPPAPTPTSIPEIERRIAEARQREHTAVERLSKADAELSEVDALLAGGVCPRCHQPVRTDEFAAHRSEASAAAATAQTERLGAATEIERLEAERKSRERFERAHDRWSELEKRRATLREAVTRRAADAEDAERSRSAAEARVESLREQVRSLEPEEGAVARLRSAVAEAETARERARSALERAQRASDRVGAADEALRALATETERAERELAVLDRRARERSERVAALSVRVAEGASASEAVRVARSAAVAAEHQLSDERAALVRADTRLDAEVRRAASAEKGRSERARLVVEATDLEQKAEWVNGPFRLHLLAMEQELLAHAQATFDRSFARYFASLVDDPALVARTDVGFTPEVMIDGEPTPAEALSGGERTALALAFRLALAAVVRSLGEVRLETLLLDEPTDGFSAEQVIRMGELLGELDLPQVIIVSHEAQLASVADRTVRVRKEDGRAILETDRTGPSEPLADAESPAPPRFPRTAGPADEPT